MKTEMKPVTAWAIVGWDGYLRESWKDTLQVFRTRASARDGRLRRFDQYLVRVEIRELRKAAKGR